MNTGPKEHLEQQHCPAQYQLQMKTSALSCIVDMPVKLLSCEQCGLKKRILTLKLNFLVTWLSLMATESQAQRLQQSSLEYKQMELMLRHFEFKRKAEERYYGLTRMIFKISHLDFVLYCLHITKIIPQQKVGQQNFSQNKMSLENL